MAVLELLEQVRRENEELERKRAQGNVSQPEDEPSPGPEEQPRL